ncbi:DNA primase [Aciduliprofundum sp. MAR08-339]|uniref:DNA primase DnaG n=1 Tax=Aciduliprofundum sp. (strain MAR08-339) TaxID=673860 RepID=UPI0002A4C50A|nr:DNA primase [Aciduliprofundum sp. MAR08-339]
MAIFPKNKEVKKLNTDPYAAKYLIRASIETDGIVERPDVVGAIFGQTEGLLGDELDLRDLQKSGRIGRIEVDIKSEKGKSVGEILIPSSLDQVETAILAAALETIDRVGPCRSRVKVISIEDIRATKRQRVVDRAKELLQMLLKQGKQVSEDLVKSVREAVEIEEVVIYGEDHLPAGPNVEKSEAIIVVEGRSDVINLLNYGIKNAIAVNGTNVPKTIIELSKKKIVTAFLDGDHGGDLILKELLQVADIDFIARAPPGYEVEELTYKQIVKALRNKVPVEQYIATHNLGDIKKEEKEGKKEDKKEKEPKKEEKKEEKKEGEDLVSLFKDLNSKKEAALLKDNKVILRIPLNELIEKLKSAKEKGDTLVTGGIISQRLVDVAHEKGIGRIIGYKIGNVTKRPLNMKLLTKDMVKK